MRKETCSQGHLPPKVPPVPDKGLPVGQGKCGYGFFCVQMVTCLCLNKSQGRHASVFSEDSSPLRRHSEAFSIWQSFAEKCCANLQTSSLCKIFLKTCTCKLFIVFFFLASLARAWRVIKCLIKCFEGWRSVTFHQLYQL